MYISFKIMAIQLTITTQKFNSLNKDLNVSGFIFNYNNTNYIFTVHHMLPIENVTYNNNILIQHINSSWSEVLILQTNNIDIEPFIINKDHINKISKINENIYMDIGNNFGRVEMIIADYDFIPFDNMKTSPLMPYLKAKFKDIKNDIDDILPGLSGSPVYNSSNKIIGVFSKYNINMKTFYIIPIYIYIKNLERKDNTNIYMIPHNNILKINSYNIKDNNIYNPTLKIDIPLSSFFLIECDSDTQLLIKYIKNKREYNDTLNPVIIKHFDMSYENHIINKNDIYKINNRLLNLIKKLNIFGRKTLQSIHGEIFNNISTELWLKYDESTKELSIN